MGQRGSKRQKLTGCNAIGQVWCRHGEIVEKSLLLFHELAAGYSSSKTLLKLQVVSLALQHHGPTQLPFLTLSGNPRHRTTFYTTLTRILLMDEHGLMDFEAYMQPFVPVLQHLAAFFSEQVPGGENMCVYLCVRVFMRQSVHVLMCVFRVIVPKRKMRLVCNRLIQFCSTRRFPLRSSPHVYEIAETSDALKVHACVRKHA